MSTGDSEAPGVIVHAFPRPLPTPLTPVDFQGACRPLRVKLLHHPPPQLLHMLLLVPKTALPALPRGSSQGPSVRESVAPVGWVVILTPLNASGDGALSSLHGLSSVGKSISL